MPYRLKKEELEKILNSRLNVVPWINTELIKSLRGAIVGLGNLGSHAALMLYSLGIKELHLVDKDIVEIVNLQRQFLYSVKDAGKPKAEAAREYLKEKFSGIIDTKLVPAPADISHSNLPWAELDFVFCCVDNSEARKFILEKCLEHGITLIDTGLEFYESQFGYALLVDRKRYPDGACSDCYVDFSKPVDYRGCISAGVPYSGMLIASAGAGLFIHHLMGHNSRNVNHIWIDLNSMDSGFVFLKKRKSCGTCDEK